MTFFCSERSAETSPPQVTASWWDAEFYSTHATLVTVSPLLMVYEPLLMVHEGEVDVDFHV